MKASAKPQSTIEKSQKNLCNCPCVKGSDRKETGAAVAQAFHPRVSDAAAAAAAPPRRRRWAEGIHPGRSTLLHSSFQLL